nr:HAMP domain-containing methyl-accepting chemotaxis protein [Rhizobium leguminosarum]
MGCLSLKAHLAIENVRFRSNNRQADCAHLEKCGMKLTISRKLFAFAFIVSVGIGGALVFETSTINRLKVTGPVYDELIDSKDLVADILPPPLFLVEAYMLAYEAASHPEMTDADVKGLQKLRIDYGQRRDHWGRSYLPSHLKAQLANEVVGSGDLFWRAVDEAYLPALSRKDAAALDQALDALADRYHVHEAAVLKLVDAANDYQARTQKAAEQEVESRTLLALVAGLLALALFIGGAIYLRLNVVGAVTRMTSRMASMADGDLERSIPFEKRADEIGLMAKALGVFRQASLDKTRLEDEARREQAVSEAERAEREARTAREAAELQEIVATLGAGLARLAECNIRMTIDQPFVGEFERLRHDFNNSIAAFQTTLEQVLSQTTQIDDSGQEMRTAADNLARRTEQQAAALEETSAALEQVTSTVKVSAEHTLETRSLVRETKECAAASGKIVKDAVAAMSRIETASQEIAQIIGVIDEIAFQTNLLALNAGVEAARAGDSGKGFAVVAQEVRELAQRSARAAREIKDLIGNSTQEVSKGVKHVGEAGRAIDQIDTFVRRIDQNIDAIATAASEQSVGLQQIASAVNEIDQMTQQNAAMVEETSAVSHALADGVQRLAGLVGRFKLNRRGAIREPGSEVERNGAYNRAASSRAVRAA